MQETQIQSLTQEDPTPCGATKLTHHNYWSPHSGTQELHLPSPCATTTEACIPRAHASRQKPLQWPAHTPQLESGPRAPLYKGPCSDKDPTQPKINKTNFFLFKKSVSCPSIVLGAIKNNHKTIPILKCHRMDQPWIIKPFSRLHPWNACKLMTHVTSRSMLCPDNNHRLNDYAVLSSKRSVQLTSDSSACFLHTWPRILYVVIKTSPYSSAMSWSSPSIGLLLISQFCLCGQECDTTQVRHCHMSKALWDSAWGLPSLSLVKTCPPPASACLLPSFKV